MLSLMLQKSPNKFFFISYLKPSTTFKTFFTPHGFGQLESTLASLKFKKNVLNVILTLTFIRPR